MTQTAIVPVTSTPVTFAGARLVGYSEHPRMSDETVAFDADVYVHDQKVGVLTNDGRGGAHMFRPSSRAGIGAFRAAEEAFPGIVDAEHGFTNDLMDTLALTASLAKAFGGRKVVFAPDTKVEDFVANPLGASLFEIPSRFMADLDKTLPFLLDKRDATTLLYPRRGKGYWFYLARR